MKQLLKLFILAAALLPAACNCRVESEYADPRMWCRVPEDCRDSVDVFYVVSTDILESVDEEGRESPLALLNEDEKALLAGEIDFIHRELFPDSLNYFAPYYHQVTLKALLESDPEEYSALIGRVGQEICDAFDYYMDNMNEGRPFVLAGFSQGAILVEKLLNHMTDGQYERMVAAYMIGYGLDSAALASPHIKPATGAYDTGVTVSFNSVRDTASVWELVQNDARCCINPVNWTTDVTSADFSYDGDTLTATLDTLRNVVIVDGYDTAKYESKEWDGAPWPDGNYHHFEIQFYNPYIRQNVLNRIR